MRDISVNYRNAEHSNERRRPVSSVHRGRFVVIVGLGLLAVVTLGAGIAQGKLPMNIVVSGQRFTASVSAVEAQGIEVYPRAAETAGDASASIAAHIQQVRLTDLCLSTVAHGVPFLGDVTMSIRAPGDGTTASGITLDAASLGGAITAHDARLGAEVSALGEVSELDPPDASAITAGDSMLAQARVEIISLTATQVVIDKLAMSVEKGAVGC